MDSKRPSPATRQLCIFEIDMEHYPNDGGTLKVIAAIEEPAVIARILMHLGLPAKAGPH